MKVFMFSKVAGWRPETFLRINSFSDTFFNDSVQIFFISVTVSMTFKNKYFELHLSMATSFKYYFNK